MTIRNLGIPPIFLLTILFTIGPVSTFAQGYNDTTEDGSYVYVDFYDDAPAPMASCQTKTIIYNTLNGVRVSAQAIYPNTAYATSHASDTSPTTYPLVQEVIHYGQQRGGNCGVFLDSVHNLTLRLGVSVNIYQYSTIANGLAYYYPIDNCNTKCRHGGVTGPVTPFYEYVIENFNWFQYSTAPNGYSCAYALAVPSNNVPSTGAICYDRGLP